MIFEECIITILFFALKKTIKAALQEETLQIYQQTFITSRREILKVGIFLHPAIFRVA